mgnify:CR=1 FL=1
MRITDILNKRITIIVIPLFIIKKVFIMTKGLLRVGKSWFLIVVQVINSNMNTQNMMKKETGLR